MAPNQKTWITLSRIQQLGYAVTRTEWRGQVEYTAWPRSPGAAVLTVVEQLFDEHKAVLDLRTRVEQQSQTSIACSACSGAPAEELPPAKVPT